MKILDLIKAAGNIMGVSVDAPNIEKKTCSCPKCCDES
jgi:hypothetical protein